MMNAKQAYEFLDERILSDRIEIVVFHQEHRPAFSDPDCAPEPFAFVKVTLFEGNAFHPAEKEYATFPTDGFDFEPAARAALDQVQNWILRDRDEQKAEPKPAQPKVSLTQKIDLRQVDAGPTRWGEVTWDGKALTQNLCGSIVTIAERTNDIRSALLLLDDQIARLESGGPPIRDDLLLTRECGPLPDLARRLRELPQASKQLTDAIPVSRPESKGGVR
jgi:hypothetical protein